MSLGSEMSSLSLYNSIATSDHHRHSAKIESLDAVSPEIRTAGSSANPLEHPITTSNNLPHRPYLEPAEVVTPRDMLYRLLNNTFGDSRRDIQNAPNHTILRIC